MLVTLLGATGQTLAHESRPAYLEIVQQDSEQFVVLWKLPALGDRPSLPISIVWPEDTDVVGEPLRWRVPGASLERYTVRAPGGLAEKSISIGGLSRTLSDVMVNIEYASGQRQAARMTPSTPELRLAAQTNNWNTAKAYLGLGVEHILLGIDHLAFVTLLFFLASGGRALIYTITAFTVGHSFTLLGVSLGWLVVASTLIEAFIALSIVTMAVELVYATRGRRGLASRYPWAIAVAFGLLHGLGFAGALADIGLPEHALLPAVLFFNIGVELGQLLFVAALGLVVLTVKKRLPENRRVYASLVVAYTIGILSAYWTLERGTALLY